MPHDVRSAHNVLTHPMQRGERSTTRGRPPHRRADAAPTHVTRPSTQTRRALLLEGVHPDAVAVLQEAGFSVDLHKGAMDEDQLVGAIRGVEVLGVRSGTPVTRRVLEAGDRLRAIGAFCIGTDQVDLAAATDHGVAVFNAPFSNTRSVVELALAEIIALTRRLTVRDTAMHAGVWDKSASGSHEVRGRCLGIVGYGNIGSQLSVVAEALGMSVVFYDTADRLPLGNAQRCRTLTELLAQADVVSLHVDGRSANAGLFGDSRFSCMRPGAIFLNLSRGFVVDHAALRRHLLSGHLAGAAVDVFPQEPRRPGQEFRSELQGLPNVILTPHVGGSTEEAQRDIAAFVATKLCEHAADGSTSSSVNLPQVSLPRSAGTTRLRLLHRSDPAVLDRVHAILDRHAAPGGRQAAATHGSVGYLLRDLPAPLTAELAGALAGLPQVIRADLHP